MKEIYYTLLSDGSSDRVLMPIINWLLNDLYPEMVVQGYVADFSGIKNPPALSDLSARIKLSLRLYPCDILFVHRDAEKQLKEVRENEIMVHWEKSMTSHQHKMIPVVPVRMTETWLLIDEKAIKIASGNRNFDGPIKLPHVARLEHETDPKELLFRLLRTTSNLKGRNLDKFNVHFARHIVADNIEDFSVLRQLDAFRHFEDSLKKTIDATGK